MLQRLSFGIIKCISKTLDKSRLFSTTACALHEEHHHRIARVGDDAKKKMVTVYWENGHESHYPHIFLRDNCPCPKCFNPDTKSRLLDTVNQIDLHIKTDDVNHDVTNHDVTITWPDKHQSVYPADWLRKRIFPADWNKVVDSTIDKTPIPWAKEDIAGNLPFVDYEAIVTEDGALLQHYENLLTCGLSIIRNSPKELSTLSNLAERMASSIVRRTNYSDYWVVKSKASPSNLAYTGNGLPLHTDLPFYEYQPGVQFLHCIEQAGVEGQGENILADGHMVANELKRQSPEKYELLTRIKFKFNDVGTDMMGEFNLQFERPIICLNLFGEFESISINNMVRDSFINAPVEEVFGAYEAYYKLYDLLNNEEKFSIRYKMEEGDVLVFNNKRVLHGRSYYNAQATSRFLHGMYIDWDEIKSGYRVTKGRVIKDLKANPVTYHHG